MEGMAASTGLFPPASGVLDAICDFRLEGMPTLTAVYCGCAFRCGAAGAATGVTLGLAEASAELFPAEAGSEAGACAVWGALTEGINPTGVAADGELFATPDD